MKTKRPIQIALIGLLLSGTSFAGENAWRTVKESKKLKISNRDRPGSDIKEVKAVGLLDCIPWVCKNVVDRVDKYPDFMPYTETVKILKETDSHLISYQYLNMPFISDRDYTIKIKDRTYRRGDGTVIYKKSWSPANQLGPKKKDGVVRLITNEGYWQFEPVDGGQRSRATYYLYTDPGGALPAFLINKANTSAIPDLFKAIERASKKPFYKSFRPKEPAAKEPASSPVPAN
jgi:ribosome-associated toxin RatA of RatAB toxin-antitoxin module